MSKLNDKYDAIFSHFVSPKAVSLVHELTEFCFPEIPFKYLCHRILLIIINFELTLVLNGKETGQNHKLTKMRNQHLHYLIPLNSLQLSEETK